MKVILLEGKANTGKTTLANKIKYWLEENQFVQEAENSKGRGFSAVYSKTIKGKEMRIHLNSLSDTKRDIQERKEFYDINKKGGYDIFITAIRPKEINPNLNLWLKRIYERDISELEKKLEVKLEHINSDYLLKKFISLFESLL